MSKPGNTQYHLAQINVAHALAPLDDPLLADFVNQLDAVNALAEQSQGFVWRLQSESGNATDIKIGDDPNIIVNMSVWESRKELFAFVYRSNHRSVLARRLEWFAKPEKPTSALWWIPEGNNPTVEHGLSRLETLQQEGPTSEAFTFSDTFEPPAPVHSG